MADPKYTAITKSGLEAIVDASTFGTLIELKYFVPIYDWRADASVNPIDFTDENVNITTLYTDLDIGHTDINLNAEILYKGDLPYSLSLPHTSADANTFSYMAYKNSTTATTYNPATSAFSNIPYGTPQAINIVDGEAVYGHGWKISNTDFNWTHGSSVMTNAIATSAGSVANPNTPTSATILPGLYDTMTYTSISNEISDSSIKSRAAFNVTLGENIAGDFKFNMIATYCIKRNANFELSDTEPTLFSLTVLPNTIIKANSIENAIQNFSFDLNLDYIFDETGSFSKILYVDRSDERSIGWHTKQDNTIGAGKNVAILDKYNSADYLNMSKLLVGVTKYLDANGDTVTAIPSFGEVYQDETDPFPTNWKKYKVMTTPISNGYEITFDGDYDASILGMIEGGSGWGFPNVFGYYPRTSSVNNSYLANCQDFFAPMLGIPLDNANSLQWSGNETSATNRWDSLHTLNGFTSKNLNRIHPLWDYITSAGEQLLTPQDYANDYNISAEVLTGFKSNNLSFIINNTFELWLSDAPAYTAVNKTVMGYNNLPTSIVEDVWNPYFGVHTGDLYKHWIRTSTSARSNQDLFIRTDITQATSGYDVDTYVNGDIYLLAGFDDQSAMHRKSASQLFNDGASVALRRLKIKALEIIIDGDVLPNNVGTTLGNSSSHWSEIYTDSLNNILRLGFARGSRGTAYALEPHANLSGAKNVNLGAYGNELKAVYTDNVHTSRINNLSLGWNDLAVSTATIVLTCANALVTSANQAITAASNVISNFSYSASPDKTIAIKFKLDAKIDIINDSIPYLELVIADQTFNYNVNGGTSKQMKFILALPYLPYTSATSASNTIISSNVDFIFNSDGVTHASNAVSPISLIASAKSTEFVSTGWWITATNTQVAETVALYGVLTDDSTFTFADFNAWYESNKSHIWTDADGNYFFPYYNTSDVVVYAPALTEVSSGAQQFVTWLDANRDDTVNQTYKSRINEQFAADMTANIAYGSFSDAIDDSNYCQKILSNVTALANNLIVSPNAYSSAVSYYNTTFGNPTTWLTSAGFDSIQVLGTSATLSNFTYGFGDVIDSTYISKLCLYLSNGGPSDPSRAKIFWAHNGISHYYLQTYNKVYYPTSATIEPNVTKVKLLALNANAAVSETNPAFNRILNLSCSNGVVGSSTPVETQLNYNGYYAVTETEMNTSVIVMSKSLPTYTSATTGVGTSANASYLNKVADDIRGIITAYNTSADANFQTIYNNTPFITVFEKNITLTNASNSYIFNNVSNIIYSEFGAIGFGGYSLIPQSTKMNMNHTISYRGLFAYSGSNTRGNVYALVYYIINVNVPKLTGAITKTGNDTAHIFKTDIIPLPFDCTNPPLAGLIVNGLMNYTKYINYVYTDSSRVLLMNNS
jgi:hypothetical protein